MILQPASYAVLTQLLAAYSVGLCARERCVAFGATAICLPFDKISLKLVDITVKLRSREKHGFIRRCVRCAGFRWQTVNRLAKCAQG